MMFPYVIQNKKFTNYWLVFITLMFILILIVLLKKYDDEINYIGLNENNQIKILVKEEDIISLPNKIVLNNQKYNYEIEEISNEYYVDNEINYKMVTISSEYITSDKIVNVKFIRGETRILNEIIKIIKGGTL